MRAGWRFAHHYRRGQRAAHSPTGTTPASRQRTADFIGSAKIFAGRRAPPGERIQRRSTTATRAVLEIAIVAGGKRCARRIGSAFANSISVGADGPVRVARQIYGRGRGRLMSHGLRHCRRRQQRGDAGCRQDHFQACSHGFNLMCVSGFSPGFRQLCDIPHRTRGSSVTHPSRNCASKCCYYNNLIMSCMKAMRDFQATKD